MKFVRLCSRFFIHISAFMLIEFLFLFLSCSLISVSGSIYEISGSEVCFSTGDLIKVIGIELLSVSCEDISSNDKFELPINHTGQSVL